MAEWRVNMQVRRLRKDDMAAVMDIYGSSGRFMAENGNAGQWGDNYPDNGLVESYIEKDGYVVTQKDEIIGVFIFSDNDESYNSIVGEWLDNEPYGVIHMLATGGTRRGAGQFILDWCLDKTGNIRIDTHKDNIPMRNLLEKNGYKYCGTVTLGSRGERMAFQKNRKTV